MHAINGGFPAAALDWDLPGHLAAEDLHSDSEIGSLSTRASGWGVLHRDMQRLGRLRRRQQRRRSRLVHKSSTTRTQSLGCRAWRKPRPHPPMHGTRPYQPPIPVRRGRARLHEGRCGVCLSLFLVLLFRVLSFASALSLSIAVPAQGRAGTGSPAPASGSPAHGLMPRLQPRPRSASLKAWVSVGSSGGAGGGAGAVEVGMAWGSDLCPCRGVTGWAVDSVVQVGRNKGLARYAH